MSWKPRVTSECIYQKDIMINSLMGIISDDSKRAARYFVHGRVYIDQLPPPLIYLQDCITLMMVLSESEFCLNGQLQS